MNIKKVSGFVVESFMSWVFLHFMHLSNFHATHNYFKYVQLWFYEVKHELMQNSFFD